MVHNPREITHENNAELYSNNDTILNYIQFFVVNLRLKWQFWTGTYTDYCRACAGHRKGVWRWSLELRTHSIKIMGQLEELKLFISERLHAVTAEILGAIEKAITDYEDQVSPLKEENGLRLPMLDTVVKSSIPKTEGGCINGCIN